MSEPTSQPAADFEDDILDAIETAREIGKVTDFVPLLEELQRLRDAVRDEPTRGKS